jgi:hypothetical protein
LGFNGLQEGLAAITAGKPWLKEKMGQGSKRKHRPGAGKQGVKDGLVFPVSSLLMCPAGGRTGKNRRAGPAGSQIIFREMAEVISSAVLRAWSFFFLFLR